MKILIDNGHGEETPGKRSPDGRLREYRYAREIAERLERRLVEEGLEVVRIVPEEWDVPLRVRTRRVNKICDKEGARNVLLVSIHCDGVGDGTEWMPERGWSARISLNASERSKRLARCLIDAAAAHGLQVRKYAPFEPWWPQNLAICRDTKCPAVLTENLFQDNCEDVCLLLSEAGRKAIVETHVQGIIKYIEKWA